MPRKSDKRVRLVEAAKSLIHTQGYHLTTLADIALLADVPLGNVYYYFKTKESIGDTVINALATELHELLSSFDNNATAKDNLNAFLQHESELAAVTSRHGNAIGGLCQELVKHNDALALSAANLLKVIIDWSEKQFKSIGCGDKSADFAIQFVSRVQGANLLAATFKKPELIDQAIKSIHTWLNTIVVLNQSTPAIA